MVGGAVDEFSSMLSVLVFRSVTSVSTEQRSGETVQCYRPLLATVLSDFVVLVDEGWKSRETFQTALD